VPVFKAQKSNDLKYKTALTGCLLPEQIHNKISRFKGFDLGTYVFSYVDVIFNYQYPECA